MRRARACVLALGLGACGGAADDGGTSTSDAGPTTSICFMRITTIGPQPLMAPGVITVAGEIDAEDLSVQTFEWTVVQDGAAVPVDTGAGATASFMAEVPGIYEIILDGSTADARCIQDRQSASVRAQNGNLAMYRLRATAGEAAPVQEQVISIYGGADVDLGTVTLQAGVEVRAALRDAQGEPVAAYVRIGRDGLVRRELVSSGDSTLRLMPENHDVLVVPTAALAPLELRGVAPGALASVVVDRGTDITGTVCNADGTPLAGARVSGRVAGVPTTLATTDASGRFTLHGRGSARMALTVVPPSSATAALPVLDLTADAGFTATGPLEIDYAAPAPRVVAMTIRRTDSVAAAGARTTWIARPMAAAAVVRAGSATASASGSVRAVAMAGEDGAIGPLALPAALYDVIVEPPAAAGPGQAVAVYQVDLRGTSAVPAVLSLARPAIVTATVTSADGVPLAGVEVVASPDGLLASTMGAGARALSAADGSVTVWLAGNADYRLAWTSPERASARAHAPLRTRITAPPPGEQTALGTVALPRAIAVRGRVDIAGVAGRASGVHLALLCYECAGVQAQTPIAEAVSAAGEFELVVPDPGLRAAPDSQARAAPDSGVRAAARP